MVVVGDFAKINTSVLAVHGIKRNDIVYVAGDYYVQTDKDKDPYKYRKILLVGKVDGDGHIDASGCIAIDGKRMEPVSGVVQARLNAVKEADFGEQPNDTID